MMMAYIFGAMMLISQLINTLIRMKKDFGDYPIDIQCDYDRKNITAALWEDGGQPFINARTMGDKNDLQAKI